CHFFLAILRRVSDYLCREFLFAQMVKPSRNDQGRLVAMITRRTLFLAEEKTTRNGGRHRLALVGVGPFRDEVDFLHLVFGRGRRPFAVSKVNSVPEFIAD